MIKFTDKEKQYVKGEIVKINEMYDTGTLEEIKGYIEYVGAEQLEHVLFFNRDNCKILETIEDNEYTNKRFIEFLFYGLGMFAFRECGCTTADECFEYVKDEVYCDIFEKIIQGD